MTDAAALRVRLEGVEAAWPDAGAPPTDLVQEGRSAEA